EAAGERHRRAEVELPLVAEAVVVAPAAVAAIAERGEPRDRRRVAHAAALERAGTQRAAHGGAEHHVGRAAAGLEGQLGDLAVVVLAVVLAGRQLDAAGEPEAGAAGAHREPLRLEREVAHTA